MNNSCFIFFYEGYVGVAPTIINLSKTLNDNGYSVTIYATKNQFITPEKIGDRTKIVYFSKASDLPLIAKKLGTIYKFKLGTLIPIIDLLFFVFNSVIDILQNNNKEFFKNKITIGVDTNGSILALFLSLFFRSKFIYLSLELYNPIIFRRFTKLIKLIEQLAYRNSECVIIQDKDRFTTLCKYNRYQHPKVFYLPNSPISSRSLIKEAPFRNYFRDLFNLDEENFPHIILQAGMIGEAVFSKHLAEAFASINNGCALIFHEREKLEMNNFYIKSLKEVNSNNLFLSLNPLPYEQISRIYSSATIGLAFYRNLDKNFSQISMASGKLSHYLMHGKPVLVSNLDSLSKLVEKYKIGIVIQEPSNSLEIQSAIELILSNYPFYSKNAKRCFEEEFDFTKKVKPILSFMSSL